MLHQLSVSLEVKNFRQEESAACLSATIPCNIIMTILKNEAGFTFLKINSFCELEVGQYMFTLRNLCPFEIPSKGKLTVNFSGKLRPRTPPPSKKGLKGLLRDV